MSSTLVQERPLVISPTLAATIGLEEAVMLQVLHEYAQMHPRRSRERWCEIGTEKLLELLPFWSEHDCQRISTSLRDKGVLALDSRPLGQSNVFRFNLDAGTAQEPPSTRSPSRPVGGKSLLGRSWNPDEEVLRQISLHGIPREFAFAQLDEFVLYWSERGEPAHSWNARFRSHVIRRWREHEELGPGDDSARRMSQDWRPGPDALEILDRAGVNAHFVEDAIPEFVLYWSERGETSRTWNSRFVAHVKRQWARYTATMDLDAEPRRLGANWKPSEDVFEILRMANIDEPFAHAQLAEFRLYWRERAEAHSSWNSKFLQHVKYHWARAHENAEREHAHGKGSRGKGSTRSRSLVEDLTDRSWAR